MGCHNINHVNPCHFNHAILKALEPPLAVPVVWNSSGYERWKRCARWRAASRFPPDLKYVDTAVPALLGAPDYFEYASKALLGNAPQPARRTWARRADPRGLIVRQPDPAGLRGGFHARADWIAANLPARGEPMAQYTPAGRARTSRDRPPA